MNRGGFAVISRIVVLVLCASVVLAGCAKSLVPITSSASPEEVAGRYFELLSQGQRAAAEELMWRPERWDSATPDGSLKGLTGLRVGQSREDSAAGRPEDYRELQAIRELSVSYVRHRTSPTGEAPGADMRFVLLGRETSDGPWMVLETGTGP